MGVGLYIHVPFCKSKCPYCDFYSVKVNNALVEGWFLAVLRNLEHYGEKYGKIPIDTVYFGGGTPSLVPEEMLHGILKKADEVFCFENPEISLEANPCSVDLDKLKNLKAAGFNRISFGVQSLDENELKFLGRLHNFKEAIWAIENAALAGFENISADIMLGIAGQTKNSLYKTISDLARLPVVHISAYMLKIEKGTPFDCQQIKLCVPDDDKTAELYLFAVKALEDLGFHQYEISNFAKNTFECRHNLHYWRCEEYIGIGPGAHSFFDGKRFAAKPSLDDFIKNPFQSKEITDSSPAGFEEFAMLGIRLLQGLDLGFCEKKYGIDAKKILQRCDMLKKNGFVKVQGKKISLTAKGCLLSNSIISMLFIDFQ